MLHSPQAWSTRGHKGRGVLEVIDLFRWQAAISPCPAYNCVFYCPHNRLQMCLLKASLSPLTPLSAFYPSFQWLLLTDQREVGRYGRSGAIGRAS